MRASEIGAGIESSGRYLGYLAVAHEQPRVAARLVLGRSSTWQCLINASVVEWFDVDGDEAGFDRYGHG